MKIQITFGSGNDFSCVMVCEHCGHIQKIRRGYYDDYRTAVIPAMRCKSCRKDRAGTLQPTEVEQC